MFTSIEGVYRKGRVELSNVPMEVRDETPVIVTFLEPQDVDLRALGIGEARAAELRSRLAQFSEDWESPEMSGYDDYDASLAAIQAR